MNIQPDQPELLRLLQRQGEIQRAMRRPGGIRVTVERELHAIREELKNFPLAVKSMHAPGASPMPQSSPNPAASSPTSACLIK